MLVLNLPGLKLVHEGGELPVEELAENWQMTKLADNQKRKVQVKTMYVCTVCMHVYTN